MFNTSDGSTPAFASSIDERIPTGMPRNDLPKSWGSGVISSERPLEHANVIDSPLREADRVCALWIVRKEANKMNAESKIEVAHLFDARLHFTGTVDYGYTLAQSAAGVPIPELGARFDVFFEGEVSGARLNGNIKGVDYVSLSPDGVSTLHIHAHITTHDGCHIALHSDGIARRRKESVLADLHESMSFATAAESYLWINRLRGAGTGIVDTQAGQIEMTVRQES